MGKSFCLSESNTCFCVKGQNSSGCSLQSLLTRLFSPVVRSSGLRTCVEAYMKNSEISSKVSLPIIVPNLNSFFTISNASRIQCFFLSNIYSPPQLREGVLRKSIILCISFVDFWSWNKTEAKPKRERKHLKWQTLATHISTLYEKKTKSWENPTISMLTESKFYR